MVGDGWWWCLHFQCTSYFSFSTLTLFIAGPRWPQNWPCCWQLSSLAFAPVPLLPYQTNSPTETFKILWMSHICSDGPLICYRMQAGYFGTIFDATSLLVSLLFCIKQNIHYTCRMSMFAIKVSVNLPLERQQLLSLSNCHIVLYTDAGMAKNLTKTEELLTKLIILVNILDGKFICR